MSVPPRRRIVPPLYLVAAILASAALHYFLPLAQILPEPYSLAGAAVLLAGLAITATAATSFRRARTPVRPFETSTALVTGGLFRFTRNPMYLGMALMLLGEALLFGSAGAFLPLPLFVWWIDRTFVRPEEAFLEGIFGQPYLDYKARVRRWL